MKNLFWLLIFLSITAFSHEYEFKDKYGKVVGYVDGNEIKDQYGKVSGYIDEYQINDKYGNLIYAIRKEDD